MALEVRRIRLLRVPWTGPEDGPIEYDRYVNVVRKEIGIKMNRLPRDLFTRGKLTAFIQYLTRRARREEFHHGYSRRIFPILDYLPRVYYVSFTTTFRHYRFFSTLLLKLTFTSKINRLFDYSTCSSKSNDLFLTRQF